MEDIEPIPIFLNSFLQSPSVYLGFTLEAFFILLCILILLIFSGMISGSEIAFFSLNPSQKEEILESKKKSIQVGLKLLKTPKNLLAGILISNNFINITIILLSTHFSDIVFNFEQNKVLGMLVQVGVITTLLLLFGEIMPKILAKQKPILFVQLMAKPLRLIILIFKPLILMLSRTTSLIDKRLEKHKPQLSMKDLSDVVELASEMESEEVEKENQDILKGITTFGEKDVKEIMKARVDVKALDNKTKFAEVLQHIQKWGYSRIPVYEKNLDQIKGLLYVKDLLTFIDASELDWASKLRPAFFVPENKKINDLLQEFRMTKIHLAIVVDEYGGTSGIVSLEDVLEEIVGDINDEFDHENDEFQYQKINSNTWIFEAKSSLLDFCKIIDVDSELFDEVKGESDSLGGLILELKGDIPVIHERIIFEQFEFEILEMGKRRIDTIKVRNTDD